MVSVFMLNSNDTKISSFIEHFGSPEAFVLSDGSLPTMLKLNSAMFELKVLMLLLGQLLISLHSYYSLRFTYSTKDRIFITQQFLYR
jgi:hypothetical protein